jgi:hypothetical protein
MCMEQNEEHINKCMYMANKYVTIVTIILLVERTFCIINGIQKSEYPHIKK